MNDYVGKDDILKELQQRVEDKILEPSNYDLLKKLVEKADTLDEAIKIAELGTTYRRTGFHFDKKLEKQSNTISYFKKNEELSFTTDPNATTHKLIIGDNYPALLNLLVEYKGKVDVIYIDPPYGKDSMGEFAQTNYENAISRDNLLSMLYPRLWLAKQLLSDDGIIFCSLDDKNQAYGKGLFDEVFGEKNFIANYVWEARSGRDHTAKQVSVSHEYVLCYAKNVENVQLALDERISNSGNYKDDKGSYKREQLRQWGTADRREDRPTMYYPLTAPDGVTVYPLRSDGSDGRWRVSEQRLVKMIEEGDVDFVYDGKNYQVYAKKRAGRITKTAYGTLIQGVGTASTGTLELKSIFGDKVFDTTKPKELIKYLINLLPYKASVVLDFFAGSGTTGQAVLELNNDDEGDRQFILVTNNEVMPTAPNGIAVDVTSERMKRVMTGEAYDGNKDFEWTKNNQPLGDNLQVVDLAEISNREAIEGKTAFDVIDETLYGQEKLDVNEKIKWVATNFEKTQKRLEEK